MKSNEADLKPPGRSTKSHLLLVFSVVACILIPALMLRNFRHSPINVMTAQFQYTLADDYLLPFTMVYTQSILSSVPNTIARYRLEYQSRSNWRRVLLQHTGGSDLAGAVWEQHDGVYTYRPSIGSVPQTLSVPGDSPVTPGDWLLLERIDALTSGSGYPSVALSPDMTRYEYDYAQGVHHSIVLRNMDKIPVQFTESRDGAEVLKIDVTELQVFVRGSAPPSMSAPPPDPRSDVPAGTIVRPVGTLDDAIPKP